MITMAVQLRGDACTCDPVDGPRGGYLRLLMIAVAIRLMMTTIVLMLAFTGMVTAVRRRGTASVVTLCW